MPRETGPVLDGSEQLGLAVVRIPSHMRPQERLLSRRGNHHQVFRNLCRKKNMKLCD